MATAKQRNKPLQFDIILEIQLLEKNRFKFWHKAVKWREKNLTYKLKYYPLNPLNYIIKMFILPIENINGTHGVNHISVLFNVVLHVRCSLNSSVGTECDKWRIRERQG